MSMHVAMRCLWRRQLDAYGGDDCTRRSDAMKGAIGCGDGIPMEAGIRCL